MRNHGLTALAAFLLATPVAAAPGDMDVATFLATAAKLEKKGVAAPFSSDFKRLTREVEASGEAYTARYKADAAAGRPPIPAPPRARWN